VLFKFDYQFWAAAAALQYDCIKTAVETNFAEICFVPAEYRCGQPGKMMPATAPAAVEGCKLVNDGYRFVK